MDRSADILRVTERLYAAAVTPAEWTPALGALADLVHGDHAILVGPTDPTTNNPFVSTARVDASDLRRFLSPDAVGLMTPMFNLVPVGVSLRSEFISDAEFARSAAYNEVVGPMNGFRGLHARSEGFVLTLCRPVQADDFDAEDAATLRALMPHLATVLELQRRLQTAERGHTRLASVLDRLATAVILTDAAARPIMINAPAERIIAEADGLTIDAARLAAATPAATQLLREAIAATARQTGVDVQRIRLKRRSRRLPLLMTVVPIWQLDAAAIGAEPASVAIFVSEPDAPFRIDRDAIAESFDLTRRESEIAVLLADGVDRETVAAQLGIGLGTVREHLRHVYAKVGVRSQPALIALLRGFADRFPGRG